MADGIGNTENIQLVNGLAGSRLSRILSQYCCDVSSYSCTFFLVSVSSLLGGILFGYDLGIISDALLQLTPQFDLSCLEREVIVSALLAGALLGAIIGGPTLDFIGRRPVLLANGFVFMFGALLTAFSNGLAMLIIGRIVLGISVSLAAMGECLYVSEVAPQKHRGKLVSLNELGITFGLLIAYLVGYLCSSQADGWRIMFGLAAIPAILMILCFLFLPSSPRFLVIKGKISEAEHVLQVLRPGEPYQNELTNIQTAVENEKNRRFTDLCSNVGNLRMRLIIGGGLVIFQQFSGQPNILYYAPVVFKGMGFYSTQSAALATVGLGVVKVVSTILSISLVDRVGRRKLLIAGPAVMAISMCLLAVSASLWTSPMKGQVCYGSLLTPNASLEQLSTPLDETLIFNETTSSPPPPQQMNVVSIGVAVVSLMLFVSAYAFSFGPVSWIILSEIYPSSLKGRAASICVSINWSANLLVSLTFLHVLNRIGNEGIFMIYASVCALAVVFASVMVPETRGKTLEKISREFDKGLALPWCCREGMVRHSISYCVTHGEVNSTVFTSDSNPVQ